MAIRNTLLGGTDFTNEGLYSPDLNDTMSAVKTNLNITFGDLQLDGMKNAPIGTIVAWLKTLTGTPTLPAGWAECDGVSGRPSLNSTNKFIRGTTGAMGLTGGAESHNHSITTMNGGGNTNDWANSPTSTNDGRPPFYNIVWIIKIGI